MGVYTYINDQDIERWSRVEDAELNELLQEVRQINPSILIASFAHFIKKHWYSKAKPVTLYSLRVNNGYEAQIINFHQEHEWSINTTVPKSYIMAYLFGYLNGVNQKPPTP